MARAQLSGYEPTRFPVTICAYVDQISGVVYLLIGQIWKFNFDFDFFPLKHQGETSWPISFILFFWDFKYNNCEIFAFREIEINSSSFR